MFMKDNLLENLVKISLELDDFNFRLRFEEKILREELNDALHQGLDGDDRIKHYNDWCSRYGLDYLCVK